MSSHLEPLFAVQHPYDDGQLTIRIPNPKVYMARQSHWIGRRGKARCDYCRSSNLKCDRVLPRCNHCSWANHRECRYTPLPTPAHRGIPRCDRCRAANMKCDRNLPICNNCEESSNGSTCHYTPKKKHHKSRRSEGGGSTSNVLPEMSLDEDSRQHSPSQEEDGDAQSHTFYGQNVASLEVKTNPPTLSASASTTDQEFSQTGRFTAYEHTGTGFFPRQGVSQPLYPPNTPFEFIPHSFPSENKSSSADSILEPWTKLSFPSLPKLVCRRLRQLNVSDFPMRVDFDAALSEFQAQILVEHRETMCIPAEKYMKIVNCLGKGDTSILSRRVREWITIHKMCTGHKKYNIILVPREAAFHLDPPTAEYHRRDFVAYLLNGTVEEYDVQDYDALPVMEQIYDILTYTHRSHQTTTQMLAEIIQLRYAFVTWAMAEIYVTMCPLCKTRQEDRSSSRSPGPS